MRPPPSAGTWECSGTCGSSLAGAWSSFCDLDFGVVGLLYINDDTLGEMPRQNRDRFSYIPFLPTLYRRTRAGMRWCPCSSTRVLTKKGRCPCAVSGCPPSTPSHPTLPTSPNGHVPLESPLPAPPRPRAHNVKCASHRPWYSFTHAHSPCPAASRDGNEV